MERQTIWTITIAGPHIEADQLIRMQKVKIKYIITESHTAKEIDIDEISVDLCSLTWHIPKPLHMATQCKSEDYMALFCSKI